MTPCPPPDFFPRKPKLALPPGSTDCHFHIFGSGRRYPFQEARGYTPPKCTLEHYRNVMETLGLQRAVLVQPSVYGTDNRAHLEALAGQPQQFRMVAVLDETVEDSELERMHRMGVRGVRFNAVNKGGLPLEVMEAMARRIAHLGWHIQGFLPQQIFADHEARLAALPVPLVADHMGSMNPAAGLEHPGFQALLRLTGSGRAWVKLSGSYRISREPRPPFADLMPAAAALIAANPEQMVWGSDWPHAMVDDRPMPNDGDLVDLLALWAPDEALRQRILVDNPARLYGFEG